MLKSKRAYALFLTVLFTLSSFLVFYLLLYNIM